MATFVDAAVAQRLLHALEPAEVALALAAADEVADRRARSVRAAELTVEWVRYDADRAERALAAVEPENRLVARTLEARWEARLAALAEADAALAAALADTAPLPARADLEALAADLPALWAAATTSDRDRKRLLRTLVADVTMLPEPDRAKVRVGIRWHSGAADELTLARPRPAHERRATDPAAVELARQLGPTMGNAELAAALNAAGHTAGTGKPFDRAAAGNLRYYHRIPAPGLLEGSIDPSGRGQFGRRGHRWWNNDDRSVWWRGDQHLQQHQATLRCFRTARNVSRWCAWARF